MGKMVRILNIAAFCCSVAACVMILLLASGWAEAAVGLREANRIISSFVGGYACCYGLSQWIERKNLTMAMGLMVIGTLIFVVNMAWAK